MDRDISQTNFVVFDVETTGLNPLLGDRICEIAAAKIRDSIVVENFSSLINPTIPMPRAAFEVNHISDEMLKSAPRAKDVLPRFLEFIEGSYLVAYNAKFDMSFLKSELKRLGMNLPKKILAIDVLMMARRMLPGLERYSLSFVAQELNLADFQEHRASSDVDITVKLFRNLLSRIDDAGVKDFRSFFNMFGIHREIIDGINNYKEAAIIQAIELGLHLKIKYFTASNAKLSEREVSPFELKEEAGYKYLIGHCYLRKDKRTFKLDNITSIELLEN